MTSQTASPRRIALGAILVAALYLPTLTTRFDFADDGNLVYPAPPMSLGDRVSLVTQKIQANYDDLGPFRPVLWAHWETQADLLGTSEIGWRATRLGWTILSAAALLWLFAELGVDRRAALVAAAIAFWNPWRNEVWWSLTLSEGVAMPYALSALALAARAGRRERSTAAAIGAIFATTLALGCKNTFAALVPAQIVLFLTASGEPLVESVRRRGARSLCFALPLALPVAHFLRFQRDWHAGQYAIDAPTGAQLARLLHGLAGAVAVEWFAAAFVLALLAIARHARSAESRPAELRAALSAGIALVAAGIAVYLPFRGVSGRYSMPAVWGFDLWIAALVHELLAAPPTRLRRAAFVALGIGLAGIAVANVGKQEKLAARAAVLWEAVEAAEAASPRGGTLAWIVAPELGIEEGVHAFWHLRARGHGDWQLRFFDARGAELTHRGVPATMAAPDLAVSGTREPPAGANWRLVNEAVVPYRFGLRRYESFLWRPAAPR